MTCSDACQPICKVLQLVISDACLPDYGQTSRFKDSTPFLCAMVWMAGYLQQSTGFPGTHVQETWLCLMKCLLSIAWCILGKVCDSPEALSAFSREPSMCAEVQTPQWSALDMLHASCKGLLLMKRMHFHRYFPTILIVLLAVFNDGAMIALSKDRVIASPVPNHWDLKSIFIVGELLTEYLVYLIKNKAKVIVCEFLQVVLGYGGIHAKGGRW